MRITQGALKNLSQTTTLPQKNLSLHRFLRSSLHMKSLNHFTLPIWGLKMGMHEFDFQVDSEFFSHFEQNVIEQGEFNIKLYFDKRPDMFVLTFDFGGHVQTNCDRCLATINLPVKGSEQLMVKFADEEKEEGEIWYIARGRTELNVAKQVYEIIFLALPIIKTYDCQNDKQSPCDEEMLSYLQPNEAEEDSSEDDLSNPFKDAFKDFNQNN